MIEGLSFFGANSSHALTAPCQLSAEEPPAAANQSASQYIGRRGKLYGRPPLLTWSLSLLIGPPTAGPPTGRTWVMWMRWCSCWMPGACCMRSR